MVLNITGKHLNITPALREHIESRFIKLRKWQVPLINPRIVVSKAAKKFAADALINTPSGALIASVRHDDMYLAVNELNNKLERQLNKIQHKSEARRAWSSIKTLTSVP